MQKLWQRKVAVWVAGLGCALFFTAALRPQHPEGLVLETTTQERLDTEPWWPTMATAPLKAYAGSASCTPCHKEGAGATAMVHAAQRGGDADFLKTARSVSFEADGLHYKISESPQGLDYRVTNGTAPLAKDLAWVIGAGEFGRTFLYQVDGRWQQSRVSFYTAPASLDITTGLSRSSEPGLQSALGQQLSPAEARACFGCHTVHATTSAGLEPLHAEAGLGCEACHGPAREHVSLMAAAQPANTQLAAADLGGVFDPSKLSPSDSIDFCGACHRTSADARLSTTLAFGTTVVRFQPYRLQESKCWRTTKDERLTCVACHNPHEPLNHSASFYDGKCLQCHTASATQAAPSHAALVCPKATSQCISCHMPKVTIATMHGSFTDHFIRVVRPGDPNPR